MRWVCSALTVLASSSGVTSERQAFMELVKNEIERLNTQLNSKGSLSMVFRAGGVSVSSQTQTFLAVSRSTSLVLFGFWAMESQKTVGQPCFSSIKCGNKDTCSRKARFRTQP